VRHGALLVSNNGYARGFNIMPDSKYGSEEGRIFGMEALLKEVDEV